MIKAEELLFMAITSNILEDLLINNENNVKFEIKRDLNIAKKAVSRITNKLVKNDFTDTIDQYKDYMIDYFNELLETHKKQDFDTD